MRKTLSGILVLSLVLVISGCACLSSETDLGAVADRAGMINVTTGDGTFENYNATGYHSGTEFGIAIGIPFLFKIKELYPARTNEDLMADVAFMAKGNGANAMINCTPTQESYMGFPLGIIGFYVDTTDGTGIKTK